MVNRREQVGGLIPLPRWLTAGNQRSPNLHSVLDGEIPAGHLERVMPTMTTLTAQQEKLHALRNAARAVLATPAPATMDARTAAKFLSGVARYIATTWSLDTMRRAFAALAETDVRTPPAVDAELQEPVRMLGAIAVGILPMTGPEGLRAALAYWATEEPSEWHKLTA